MDQGLKHKIHNYITFKRNIEEYLHVLGVGKEFITQDRKSLYHKEAYITASYLRTSLCQETEDKP